MAVEVQKILIPEIVLEWSSWTAWEELKIDARTSAGIDVPDRVSGVYEVVRETSPERLTIGRTTNLHRRIRQGLTTGSLSHSTGKRIRNCEDTSRLLVRWATSDRPAAAEEDFHLRHIAQFGTLPIYTKRT